MKWMREYQDLSELIIRVMNKYSFLHNKQFSYGEGSTISFSEVQVLEEILGNKDSNMTTLAGNLGVTKAAVTKTMKKLENKGFINRYKMLSNKKEIFVSVTEVGEDTYREYQQYIYEKMFKNLFVIMDQYDKSYYDVLNNFFRSVDKSCQNLIDDKL